MNPNGSIVANTDSVVRFRYRNGDLHARRGAGSHRAILQTVEIIGSVTLPSRMTTRKCSSPSDLRPMTLRVHLMLASPRQWIAFLRKLKNRLFGST